MTCMQKNKTKTNKLESSLYCIHCAQNKHIFTGDTIEIAVAYLIAKLHWLGQETTKGPHSGFQIKLQPAHLYATGSLRRWKKKLVVPGSEFFRGPPHVYWGPKRAVENRR